MEYNYLWIPIVVAAYFIVPPVLIYFTQAFRAEGSGRLLSAEFDLPKSVKRLMDARRDDLQKLGFESRGILSLSISPNAVALAEMFVNSKTDDTANVSFVYGRTAEGTVTESVSYVEFIRRLRGADFIYLQTNNTGRAGAFPDESNELKFRLPSIKDVDELYRLHLQLLNNHVPGARAYVRLDDEFAGDIVRYFEGVTRELFDRQVKRGWMKYDEERECWKPTVWGAIRMTYQELPPFKQLRAMQLKARGDRVLRELQ